MFLVELSTSVGQLHGIGKEAMRSLASSGIISVGDILCRYPFRYIDRTRQVPLGSWQEEEEVNTVAEVFAHDSIRWKNQKVFKARICDESASAALVCFGRNFLESKLPVGEKIYLAGKFQLRYGELQSSAFEFESFNNEPEDFNRVLPVYPLVGKMTQKNFRKAMVQALDLFGISVDDELPEAVMERQQLLKKKEALRRIHFPRSMKEVTEARKSLIFEELFHLMMIVARRGRSRNNCRRAKTKLPRNLRERVIKELPFELTSGQIAALDHITGDLERGYPMCRLLQGDVGCGKTLIAFLASLSVIEGGEQAVLMAPTELLARQHAENAMRFLGGYGIRVAFLSGNVRGEERALLLAALAEGQIDLLIGTHALFSKDVAFKALRLVIIDEQHRFGVLQRLALEEKGRRPDMLLMTATPIPRTLTLTAYGDMAVSEIRTLPSGRRPVVTYLAGNDHAERVYSFIEKEVADGNQGYFVYPLIEESDKIGNIKDAERMIKELRCRFPDTSVELIHSRIDEEEKRLRMKKFSDGEIALLVATSVVEVGVDVPKATFMVIEHAERFGLSQLHQLRGRVGRGEKQSYCFLVYDQELTEEGKERIKIMKTHSDGFAIAEEDFRIRGPGEMMGTRQSGYLRLTIADLVRDQSYLQEVRKEVDLIAGEDIGFLLPQNKSLRDLYAKAPPFDSGLLSSG